MTRTGAAWVVLVALAGCSSRSPGPPDTGARAVVQDLFEGLVQQDWGRAYAAVHPDQRIRLTEEQFTRLAQKYRIGLAFEPATVHVRSCEEHGQEALAHVILTGRQGTRQRLFKEGAILHTGPSGWGVVLPASFGQR